MRDHGQGEASEDGETDLSPHGEKAMAGAVTVELTIDKQGVPRTVRVSKNDPLLAQAVSTAIQQWRWAPYTLDGKAVEVETIITVIFELW